jgi:hypothetical protein
MEIAGMAGVPSVQALHLQPCFADLRGCRNPNLNTNKRVTSAITSMLRITPWRILKVSLLLSFVL